MMGKRERYRMTETSGGEKVELRCNVDKALLGVCIEVASGEIVLKCRRCKKNRHFKFPRRRRQDFSSEPQSDEELPPGK
jgi:hypothetical protein